MKRKLNSDLIKIILAITLIFLLIIVFIIIKQTTKRNREKLEQEESTAILEESVISYNQEIVREKIKISEQIPKNIHSIVFYNYDTTNEQPIKKEIKKEEEIYKFLELLSLTNWKEYIIEVTDPQYNWFYELEGDTKTIIKIGSFTVENGGYVQIIENNKISNYEINRDTYIDMISYTTKEYTLHQSDKENPTKEKSIEWQKIAFKEVKEEDISIIKEKIGITHHLLENILASSTLFLKEPTSQYWDLYIYGEYTGLNVFIYEENRFSTIINRLDETINMLKNKEIKEELSIGLKLLKEGVEEHNIDKLFEAHEYIHDYDVWVIEYPIESLTVEPIEWHALKTYFGKVSL